MTEPIRTLTPLEHDRAWHAIEGAEDPDPGTILAAVLHALRIVPPTVEDEQAASPRLRDAARTAAARQTKPAVAYSDGKGRAYCVRCARTVEAANAPLTVDHVDHWELCPSCGRHVVDVARQTTGQDDTEPSSRPTAAVTLATPCDNCDHALNWHGNHAACIFAFCGCGRFRAPEPAVGQPAEAHDTDAQPDAEFALVRETTTWTVEDER
ncbi:hypothetical protein ABT154_21525 [Streptomyces sp. NPDC001728]|uniref:hypothetical protein n=1 Tax=Streptomyces sp. NPDC001728 TaxID=3154396 RepID=UPI003319AAD9